MHNRKHEGQQKRPDTKGPVYETATVSGLLKWSFAGPAGGKGTYRLRGRKFGFRVIRKDLELNSGPDYTAF